MLEMGWARAVSMRPDSLRLGAVARGTLLPARKRCRLLIFPFDGLVYFLAVYGNTGGGFDAQPNLVTTNIHNRDDDIIPDHDAFVAMS